MEMKFRNILSNYGSGCEKYNNGIKTEIYNICRKIDNNFNLSYHIEFTQKKINFNIWFCKKSYINQEEYITISCYDKNKRYEKDKLNNIFKSNNIKEFEEKLNEIFNEYKN